MLVDDVGRKLDLGKLPPAAVARCVRQGVHRWSDRQALVQGPWRSSLFWSALDPLWNAKVTDLWGQHERRALRSSMCGTSWPQERLQRHGFANDSACLLCLAGKGTIWHRRFGCPATEAFRRQAISARLGKCASVVAQEGDEMADRFARCLFPTPDFALPAPILEATEVVHWIRRPPSGKLSGDIFTDGSGLFPKMPCLRCAGWALIVIDDAGDLVAGCYGAVPRDQAPQQTSRDGEDYAIFMSTFVCEPPCRFRTDCKGTVTCFQSGGGALPNQERAHWWGRIWATWDGEDVSMTKVLAHATAADVANGRISWWERAGNKQADRWAGKGASLHPMPQDTVDTVEGLALLAREAARWAGQQEAWLSREELRDNQGLPDRKADESGDEEPDDGEDAPPPEPGWTLEVEVPPGLKVIGHDLVMGEVAPEGGTIFACRACGVYAWRSFRALAKPCVGRARATLQGKDSRKLLGEERFPARERPQSWITGLRTLDIDAHEDLTRRMARPTQESFANRQARDLVTPVPSLSREQCLICYGLTPDDLPMVRDLARQARSMKRKRQEARKNGFQTIAEAGESDSAADVEDDDGLGDGLAAPRRRTKLPPPEAERRAAGRPAVSLVGAVYAPFDSGAAPFRLDA